MRCENCGAEVQIGDWPYCPHEHVGSRWGDDPLEPYWDEHISKEGAYITSRGQRRAIMSKNHLDYLDVSSKKRLAKSYFFVGGK